VTCTARLASLAAHVDRSAHQRCPQALGPPHPDYEQALVYAVLSLDDTLRGSAGELAGVAEQIRLASRRR
jgi:hypothetical protein